MANPVKEYYKSIYHITDKLIKEGFAVSFNYPSQTYNSVSWSGNKNLTHVLKGQPYKDVYYECLNNMQYNIKLLDHALIQLFYKFDGSSIVSYRLAYLPHPEFENLQQNPDDYEDVHYGNTLFSEMSDKMIITTPMRFEYDADVKKYVEFDHPKSHLTLGNYKDCRIAINKPISPNKFILFILRSFYLDKFKKHFKNEDFDCKFITQESISINEKKQFHFSH
ncbi:DUF2290 domain-containing protein [Flavobacterium sp. Sr18]|uniref:DUF2290 domain-containing protein n=1 Tax=Flavobacterium sp. Sr18 TaxID=935222 RepID=UPI0013E44968|nr:DUF2290 domain-containing protein [Flavobacterium sp. Sr18]QIH39124.1 DUF2290 domain-containing protein [Flavobacterium sp. Sr18]